MSFEATSRRYLVRGTVQGVGFRYFVQKAASAMNMRGTVRNLDNGSVEVVAAGTAEQLSALAALLRTGPPGSFVCGVEEEQAAVQQYDSFAIER